MPDSASTPTQPRLDGAARPGRPSVSPAATVTSTPPQESASVALDVRARRRGWRPRRPCRRSPRRRPRGCCRRRARAPARRPRRRGARRRPARPRSWRVTKRAAGPPRRSVVWSREPLSHAATALGMPSTFWPPQVTVSAPWSARRRRRLTSPATSTSTPPSAGTTTGLVNLQPKLTTSAPGNHVGDGAGGQRHRVHAVGDHARAARRCGRPRSSWWIGLWSPLASA